ncbi:MAG: mechanosensitive ion channel, partial [Gammaproteobacteria bacterium]|nr:mechanosensitive ion channel [Gammaproteobacteria bacterium]
MNDKINNNLKFLRKPCQKSGQFIFFAILMFIAMCAQADNKVAANQTDPLIQSIVAKSNQDILNSTQEELSVTTTKNQLAKQRINQLRQQFQQPINLETLTPAMIERAQLDAALAAANLDSANITFVESQDASNATQEKILNIENRLQSITLGASKANAIRLQITALQEQLYYQKNLLKLQQRALNEYEQSRILAHELYLLLLNEKDTLSNLYHTKIKQEQQLKLQEKEVNLQQQQQIWLNKLTELNQKIQNLSLDDINNNLRQQLELDILQAQEQSNLVHLQLVILHLTEEETTLEQTQKTDVPNLNASIDQANDILAACENLNDLISRKKNLLTRRSELEKQNYEQHLISKDEYDSNTMTLSTLITGYQKQSSTLKDLVQQTQQYLSDTQLQLSQAMARRQGLPGFSMQAWESFGKQLVNIPIMALESILALKDQVVLALNKVSFERLMIITLVELGWLSGWLILKTGLKRYAAKISRKREDMADNVLFIVLTLLKRNFLWVFMIMAVLSFFWLLEITTKSFFPFIALILVFFGFRVVIGAARLVLLEMSTTVSKLDRRLYQELKYGLTIGGALTLFMILAHKLPVGYEVTDFSNRSFMLFMLVISTLLLRSWKVVPSIVKSTIALGRPYLMRVVTLLSFLIPLTFFSTALIGFLGYVDFAWTLSRYEGLFLLVISVYMLMRGLWNDIAEWISEQSIKRFKNGWLISQAIVKPFDNIVKISLFLGIFVALFYLYDLNAQSYIIKLIRGILHFNLLQAKNAVITPLVIIQFTIAGIIIYWASRWTRELSFRWLFASSSDVGLRNSLSAFSQYTVVVLGILIALQIIGIDLTGISYVLGGLAFGAAFGLRDLVKNYASGLLLL